tara:strand:- start:29 stop:793 length:765 start_codon:yes stop_codon:yes gene_type:complete
VTSLSKGVVILYSESAQLDYKSLSETCARLAEKHLNVPSTIVKLEPEQRNFRTFRYPNGELEGTEWNNIGRYNAYDLSPYDETILLDSDYIVQSDTLANYFGSDHDFICHNCSWDVTGNDVFRHDRFISQNWFEMRWATVIYFRKTEHAKRIFDAWRMIYENYEYYAELFGFTKRPFRNDFAMSIAHQICNGYANSGTFNYALPALSSSDSVLDYNDGRWLLKYQYKESHNVLRYTGDLHVMNKHSLLEVADKL